MDLQEKESGIETRDDQMKTCSDCHTTTTPLWRGGPAGPKTLCNACGIKYNKKRRQLLGLEGRKQRGNIKMKKRSEGINETGRSLNMRIRELGLKKISKAKLGEEEKAALLLMTLSSESYG